MPTVKQDSHFSHFSLISFFTLNNNYSHSYFFILFSFDTLTFTIKILWYIFFLFQRFFFHLSFAHSNYVLDILIEFVTTERLVPDISPPSPSYSSTISVKFLGEIPAPFSRLQSHDLEELLFILSLLFISLTPSLPLIFLNPIVLPFQERIR